MGGPKDGQMDRQTAMYYSLLKTDNFMVVCFWAFYGDSSFWLLSMY